MKKMLRYVKCLPKTVYFNFKIFDFRTAIKLPIIISNDVKFITLHRGSVRIKCAIKTGMIKFGIDEGSYITSLNKASIWNVGKNAYVEFVGNAHLAKGFSINVAENAKLKFGNNFVSNSCCNIFADNKIIFGNDCLIGWNVSLHDGDGHKIYNAAGKLTNAPQSIKIGDHVWICADVKIFKNTIIPNNCVIARNSVVNKQFIIENAIYGGYPAKILKENITWQV